MKINVDIENTLENDLKKHLEEVQKKVRELIDDLITKTEIDATRSAPKFVSIDKKFEDGGMTGIVGVMGNQTAEMGQSDPNNVAAYFEFGTGLSAGVILAPYPQWIKDIARQFFVTGRGTLKGKPYLYPNVLKGIPVFQRELKTLIDKEIKDNG